MNKMNRYTTSIVLVLSICIFHIACNRDKNKAGLNKNFDFVILDSIAPPVITKPFVLATIMPYFDNGKWGYTDRHGDVVIRCEYDKCGFFTERFAWVSKDKKYGFIDSTGRTVVNMIYDEADDFNHGLAPVKRNNLYGFIDTTGNVEIPFRYEWYDFYSDSTIEVQENNQWGLIDRKGKHIILPIYDNRFLFSNGMAIVQRQRNYGVMNKIGKELVECNYDEMKPFGKNKFIVAKKPSYNKTFYGLIDSTNRILIPLIYEKLQGISGKVLIAMNNNNYGLLSGSNDTLIAFKYQDMKAGNTNLLAAEQKQSWGFINFSGDSILPFRYQDAKPFINRQAVVRVDGRYGTIDINGAMVIPFEFDKIENQEHKIVQVWKGQKYGFYSTEGKKITDCIYDSEDYHGWNNSLMTFGKFMNGFAIVGTKGQIGIINDKGEMVVPPKYHYLSMPNENGICIANYAGNYGLVDISGKELCEFKYQGIVKDMKTGYYFAKREYVSKLDGSQTVSPYNFGYFNGNGKLYSKSSYDSYKIKSEEETINEIKKCYGRIMAGMKSQKTESSKFLDTLVGSKTDFTLTVKDDKHKLQFEYYYNDSLNVEGPFFILIIDKSSGKPVYNRYYYDQGRIIRWIDNDGKPMPISNALFAPENDEHFRARLYVTEFNNSLCKRNKQYNLQVEQIDNLTAIIDKNIADGKYKKGDSKSDQNEVASSSSETYLNNKNQIMYESENSSGEGGSNGSVKYYSNGSIILSIETMEDVADNAPLSALWNISTKTEKTYYRNGNVFRSYLTYTNYIKPSNLGGEIKQITDN